MNSKSNIRRIGAVSAFTLASCLGLSAAISKQALASRSSNTFGTGTVAYPTDNWQAPLPDLGMMVWRFRWAFRNTWTDLWPWVQHAPRTNLWSKEGTDHYADFGWDRVDMYLFSGHGGVHGKDVLWALDSKNQWARSSEMRLGDDGDGLRILLSYACHQMSNVSPGILARWAPIFNGGLQIASGSSQCMYSSRTRQYLIADVAKRMKNGESINRAWGRANSYHAYPNKGVRTVATGVNWADCNKRRRNISIRNVMSYPVLRDNQWQTICWSTWK